MTDFNVSCTGALMELVELRDLKEQFDAMKQDVPDFATAAVLQGTQLEYQRREPLAWQSARAVLQLGRATGLPAFTRAREQMLRELAHALVVEADRVAASLRRPDPEVW